MHFTGSSSGFVSSQNQSGWTSIAMNETNYKLISVVSIWNSTYSLKYHVYKIIGTAIEVFLSNFEFFSINTKPIGSSLKVCMCEKIQNFQKRDGGGGSRKWEGTKTNSGEKIPRFFFFFFICVCNF